MLLLEAIQIHTIGGIMMGRARHGLDERSGAWRGEADGTTPRVARLVSVRWMIIGWSACISSLCTSQASMKPSWRAPRLSWFALAHQRGAPTTHACVRAEACWNDTVGETARHVDDQNSSRTCWAPKMTSSPYRSTTVSKVGSCARCVGAPATSHWRPQRWLFEEGARVIGDYATSEGKGRWRMRRN